MRGLRAAQATAERCSASGRVCRHIAASEVFSRAGSVALYLPMPEELDLRPLVTTAWAAGKRVALPRVVGPGTMDFHLHRHGDDLVCNRLGILEPCSRAARIDTGQLDLAVFPGLAFDRDGRRLGMGGGYYDRAFASAARVFRLGAGFALQCVDAVPTDDHDLRMHAVVTELGLLACIGSAQG